MLSPRLPESRALPIRPLTRKTAGPGRFRRRCAPGNPVAAGDQARPWGTAPHSHSNVRPAPPGAAPETILMDYIALRNLSTEALLDLFGRTRDSRVRAAIIERHEPLVRSL